MGQETTDPFLLTLSSFAGDWLSFLASLEPGLMVHWPQHVELLLLLAVESFRGSGVLSKRQAFEFQFKHFCHTLLPSVMFFVA